MLISLCCFLLSFIFLRLFPIIIRDTAPLEGLLLEQYFSFCFTACPPRRLYLQGKILYHGYRIGTWAVTDRHSLFRSLSLSHAHKIDAGRQRLPVSFLSSCFHLYYTLPIEAPSSFFYPRVSSLLCTLLLLWGRFVLDTRTASITTY